MTGASVETKTNPDARASAHLSNEQTFLSWLRTGFNLIAVGLAGFGQIIDHLWRHTKVACQCIS